MILRAIETRNTTVPGPAEIITMRAIETRNTTESGPAQIMKMRAIETQKLKIQLSRTGPNNDIARH